jgi:hypothetical protein
MKNNKLLGKPLIIKGASVIVEAAGIITNRVGEKSNLPERGFYGGSVA